ncbi:MAG: DUF417 family protein [Vicinamibacterales bacterium]
MDPLTRLSRSFVTAGGLVLRYGLVAIIAYFGAFKFTPTEAAAVEPLLANSPVFAWMYQVWDVGGASRAIGSAELVIAALIAARAFSPTASAVGSIAAIGMFASTLSFLVTTPGMWAWVDGFFVPAGGAGFILKDVFLLGAALWTAGDALAACGPLSRHDTIGAGRRERAA